MPPKTAPPKEKVAKGDEADEYLKSVNRPYASTDVAANLKGKVPKPAAQKIMMTLAEKGILTKKDYGKQSIFVYNQALLDRLDPAQIAVLEEKTKKVQAVLDGKKQELKALQADLSQTSALPKTKDLGETIEQMKAQNEATLNALLPYRGQGGAKSIKPLDDAEIKKIDEDWIRWKKEWETRRKVYKELLGMISDSGQVSDVTEFQDDQGIHMDDEEAMAVEKGEFSVQGTSKARLPFKSATKPGLASKAPVPAGPTPAPAKRTSSGASDQDEGVAKKKKAKKA